MKDSELVEEILGLHREMDDLVRIEIEIEKERGITTGRGNDGEVGVRAQILKSRNLKLNMAVGEVVENIVCIITLTTYKSL